MYRIIIDWSFVHVQLNSGPRNVCCRSIIKSIFLLSSNRPIIFFFLLHHLGILDILQSDRNDIYVLMRPANFFVALVISKQSSLRSRRRNERNHGIRAKTNVLLREILKTLLLE